MADLLSISPVLLFLAALALLLLALMSRAMERRKRRQEAARVQDIVARGLPQARAPVDAPAPTVFREIEAVGLGQRLVSFTGYSPDMTRVSGPPPAVVLLLGGLAAGALFLLLVAQMGPLLGGVAGALGGLLVTNLFFRTQRRTWQRRLFEQIPDAMGMITRAIRTGLPLSEALASVAHDMPEPTRSEFARLIGDVAIGRGLDQALLKLRDRSGLPEYGFLAVTLNLQARTGGSLAETLENLGELVRKRVAMAAKVKALTAEARLGAIVLIVIPILGVVVMSLLRPGYARFFIENPTGTNLAILAAIMSGIGVTIIRATIRRTMED